MHEINRLPSPPWRLRGTVILALSIGFFAPALAQQAPATIRLLPEDARRGLNGPQHNFDFLAPGATGNNYQSAGFFGQKLRPFLASNAKAVAYLDAYRRQKTLFLIDRVVAVGSFAFYGQQIFAHGDPVYFNSAQKVALGVFATSLLATVFINRNTNTHLQRAVVTYNAGLAHRGWPRLRPAAVGLGAAPTGHPLLAVRWAVR